MWIERRGIEQGQAAYPEVAGWFSIDAGTPRQWPGAIGVTIGLIWALPGLIMFFRRYGAGRANVTVDREPVPRWWQVPHGSALTLLAGIGVTNLAFALANVVLITDVGGHRRRGAALACKRMTRRCQSNLAIMLSKIRSNAVQ